MKKSIFLSIVLLILLLSSPFSSFVQGQGAEENPMATFMGVKWGITATNFEQNFPYQSQLKKDDEFFYLNDFDLGDLVIYKIRFKFQGLSGADVKFNKKNFDSLYLTEAFMFIKPDQFEPLFEIFKVKYGEPQKFDEFETRDSTGNKFIQKVARWENKDLKREIVMEKQASKIVDGVIMFIPIEEAKKVVKKDKIKEAADKI